ncbi:hypothetical protein HZA57_05695 [Candidatus Poribacteria bacterium]|nr:hypothetical protein [Candidatus Poribacteria bacterium]
MISFQDRVFLRWYDASTGSELWQTDGTTGGTTLFKDLNPAGDGYPSGFSVSPDGSHLIFLATGTGGRGLWTSDGTEDGTVEGPEFPSGGTDLFLGGACWAGSKFVFQTYISGVGSQLWATDGGLSQPIMLTDFDPLNGEGAYDYVRQVGGVAAFYGTNNDFGYEPWVTDSTIGGTFMLRDCLEGQISSYPYDFAFVTGTDDMFLFAASETHYGRELWKSRGTTGTTHMVQDLAPDGFSSDPEEFTVAGDLVFFSATTPETGRELFAIPVSSLTAFSSASESWGLLE